MDTGTAIIILGAGAFSVLVLRKHSPFWANVFLVVLFGAVMMASTTEGDRAIGGIGLLFSIVNLIFDVFTRKKKKN